MEDIGKKIAELGLGNVINHLMSNDDIRGLLTRLVDEGRDGSSYSLREITDLDAVSQVISTPAPVIVEDAAPVYEVENAPAQDEPTTSIDNV